MGRTALPYDRRTVEVQLWRRVVVREWAKTYASALLVLVDTIIVVLGGLTLLWAWPLLQIALGDYCSDGMEQNWAVALGIWSGFFVVVILCEGVARIASRHRFPWVTAIGLVLFIGALVIAFITGGVSWEDRSFCE